MQEVLFKLQKFANDPTGGAKTLDEVWQSSWISRTGSIQT
jgi:hypothetical protein